MFETIALFFVAGPVVAIGLTVGFWVFCAIVGIAQSMGDKKNK